MCCSIEIIINGSFLHNNTTFLEYRTVDNPQSSSLNLITVIRMMKALEVLLTFSRPSFLSSLLMAKQITGNVSIDVESEDNVTTVNNYYGEDKSINEISSFEPFLSETQLSRSTTDKSFVWFNTNDGSKVAVSLFGRQKATLKGIKEKKS